MLWGTGEGSPPLGSGEGPREGGESAPAPEAGCAGVRTAAGRWRPGVDPVGYGQGRAGVDVAGKQ